MESNTMGISKTVVADNPTLHGDEVNEVTNQSLEGWEDPGVKAMQGLDTYATFAGESPDVNNAIKEKRSFVNIVQSTGSPESLECGQSANLGCGASLEQGPWMIKNTPIILNKWTPNLTLCKDKVTSVLVWVKLHKVPIVAYSEDGLSLISSQLGKLVMLDAFTAAMCKDPWGRIGFARTLIEVSVAKELKQEVTMAVPHEDGTGHTKVLIKAEYEWKPPLCGDLVAPKHATNEVTTKPAVDIQTNNPFDALHDDEVCQGKEGESSKTGKEEGLFSSHNESNDELDSEVEETFMVETLTMNLKGESTPSNDVLNV
ncbi:trichome birefringence-like protein 3 [Tanacetum coccineum]